MKDFNLAEALEQMAEDDPLSVIPKDTPREQLFERLRPILQGLINESELTREATFKRLENHFRLSKDEAKALRKDFKVLYKNQQSPKEDEKAAPTALGPGIVDIVEHDGQPAFLTINGDITRQIVVEDKTYCPPAREALPFLLPRSDAVLEAIKDDTDSQLYREIQNYIYAASDLPGNGWYDLLTAWVLHTYLIEKAEYTPLIWFFAVPERGKSRTGKALIYLAYRGLHVESLRDAYLVRVSNDLQTSLFIDVAELWKKAEKNGTEDLLLSRYERGAKVPRVLYPEKGAHRDIVYYKIFGATVVATNEPVPTALDSRCIQLNMQPATRNFGNDVTPELALPLRERLVAFRYRHMETVMPDVEKPAQGRLGDILRPLAQVIQLVQPEREVAFMELVRGIEERRGVDRGETPEAKLVRVIVDLEDEVEYGRLSIKRVTDKFNEGTAEKYHSRPETIGRRLTALGFVKLRGGKRGNTVIQYDQVLVKKLSLTYLEKPSEPSEPQKATSGVGLRTEGFTEGSNDAQKPSAEPSAGKTTNDGHFERTEGTEGKTQGVSKKKNISDGQKGKGDSAMPESEGCLTYQNTGRCPVTDWVEEQLNEDVFSLPLDEV
ncbi:MAG: hypothetical protein AB1711_10630 [Thermodesulfobacteriota bacterium]